MVDVIGRAQHLGLVDVVYLDGLEHLGLDEVPDAAFRHDGDAHGLLDATDHRRVAHATHAAGRAYVCRDALEGHDRARARLLGDACLIGGGNVHDDAALEHLRQLPVELGAFFPRRLCHVLPPRVDSSIDGSKPRRNLNMFV